MVLPIIEAERIKHQMSRNELAQALGVSKRTLSNWQSGVTELSLSKLMILSKLWSCTLDYLLGLEPHEYTKTAHNKTAFLRCSTRKQPVVDVRRIYH